MLSERSFLNRPFGAFRFVTLVWVAIWLAQPGISLALDPPPPVPGPNINIVASDPYNQKQVEVEGAASPVNPAHIFAGYIDYQTVASEDPTRSPTSRGWCGWSFSTNGGRTWKNGLVDKSGNSPLRDAETCGDPVVTWDTSGHVYYVGLAKAPSGYTIIFAARFTDPDDGTGRIIQDSITVLGDGNPSNSGQVLDKPAIVYVPDAGSNPNTPGAVFACYANFDGTVGDKFRNKVLCSITRDSGQTWSKPNQGKYNGNVNTNNGTATAPSPDGVYLFWRAFLGDENGIWMVKADRNGIATAPFQVVGGPTYFPADFPTLPNRDFPTAPSLARSNSFPTVASDGGQKVVLAFHAYSDPTGVMASPSSGATPRIFVMYSSNGGATWSDPRAADYGTANAFQFQPDLAMGGDNLVSLIYYDGRNTGCFEQEPLNCPGRAIDYIPGVGYFPAGMDRRFDLRVVQGKFDASGLSFRRPSTQVTRYETSSATGQIMPRNPNCPAPGCPGVNQTNLRVAAGGYASFNGDYISHARKVEYVRNPAGTSPAWRAAVQPQDPQTFLAFWADFRRVAFPLNTSGIPDINGDWTTFVPAGFPGCANPKTRDVNVLFSEITAGGLSATARGTSQLLAAGSNQLPPDFGVTVQNLSGRDLFVRITVVDSASAGEDWSLLQTPPPPAAIPADDNSVDVKLLKNSSVTRTVYYRYRSPGVSPSPTLPVLVKVEEINAIGGSIIIGPPPGLSTSATYNLASSTLQVAGAVHGLTLSNPVVSPFSSRKSQPSNSLVENSLVENSLVENSLVENSLVENSLIPDQQVTWTVTGGGASSTAATAFTNVVNGQELLTAGWNFQLLLYTRQYNSNVNGCTVQPTVTDVVLSNLAITKPNSLVENSLVENYHISNSLVENSLVENSLVENSPLSDQVSNSTLTAGSGEQVFVTLRAFKPAPPPSGTGLASAAAPPTFDPANSNLGEAVFGPIDPVTGQPVGAFFDTTPPVITPTVSGTQGQEGWFRSDVTVSWKVADAQSPILAKTGCDTITVSQTTTLTCWARNGAGLTNQVSVEIKIDKIKPTITVTVTPASPASSGWYNLATGAPSVVITCTDADSGIPAGACPPAKTLLQGVNTSYTVTVTDRAGNTSDPVAVPEIKLDTVAPTITASVSPASAAASGWYNLQTGRPSIAFTCGDASPGSGLAATACPAAYTVPDGAGQTISRSVSDLAGNSGSVSVGPLNVDLVPPEISITTPASTNYLLNAKVTASVACSDALSGVQSCDYPASVPTGVAGRPTFTVSAADNAGNTATKSVNYYVVYNFLLSPPKSPAKLGSAVPVNWQLKDANGVLISDLGSLLGLTAVKTSPAGPCGLGTSGPTTVIYNPLSGWTGNSNLRFTTSNQFQLNWDTTTVVLSGTGCYTLVFQLKDNPLNEPARWKLTSVLLQ